MPPAAWIAAFDVSSAMLDQVLHDFTVLGEYSFAIETHCLRQLIPCLDPQDSR